MDLIISLASTNFLSIVRSLSRQSRQVYGDNPSVGKTGSFIRSDILPDRFTELEFLENKLMACLEGMVSKQNLQQCRSLILLADTRKKRARGIRDLVVTDLSPYPLALWVPGAKCMPYSWLVYYFRVSTIDGPAICCHGDTAHARTVCTRPSPFLRWAWERG